MSAPVLQRSVTDDALSATPARRDRRWLALALAGLVAVAAGIGVLLASWLGGPTIVTPAFAGGDAVATEWGSEEAYGAPGSWVIGYRDGTSMTMRVPWDGRPVAAARLGEGPVDLATVTDTSVQGDQLVVTIAFDGCDYFHERELQVYRALTVTTTDGDEESLVFDRPVFVRSPMLWQCPDRLIDRGARNRSDL